MVSSVSVDSLLVELVAGFSRIPQGVLWRYDQERWPSHLEKPPNLRPVDWLPLNDLLGRSSPPLLCCTNTKGGLGSTGDGQTAIPDVPSIVKEVRNEVTAALHLLSRPLHI